MDCSMISIDVFNRRFFEQGHHEDTKRDLPHHDLITYNDHNGVSYE
jgi:hypothetical protein